MAAQEIIFASGELNKLAQAIGQELRNAYNPGTRGGGGGGRTGGGTDTEVNRRQRESRTRMSNADVDAHRTLLTRLQNAAFDVTKMTLQGYDDLVTLSTMRNANALENILDRYGGNFTKAYMTRNAELADLGDGLTRVQIELFNESTRMFRETDLGSYYANIADMQRDMYYMQDQLASRTYNASVEMTEATMEQALRFQETMGFTGQEVAVLLRRGFIESGETSEEILNNIALHASEIEKATGIPMKAISEGMKDILSDMETFTNMTEAGAGRLTASLTETGVSLRGFKGLMEPFRDFTTAAQKMGDLSSIFGIQLDAMEMMYLANERPEEFFHRLRDDMIAQGVDMENMSAARQRTLAKTLGLTIEETRTFLETGERMTSMSELQAASQKAASRDSVEAIGLLKDQKIGEVFDAGAQKARLMDVEIAKNARSILRLKNNLVGVNTEIGNLAAGEFATALSQMNQDLMKMGSDAPAKIGAALDAAFSVDLSGVLPGIEAAMDSTVSTFGAAGRKSADAFEESATTGDAGFTFSSPSLFYMRSIKPGLDAIVIDSAEMGRMAGAAYAAGFEAALEGGSVDVKMPTLEVPQAPNPFAALPDQAVAAGNTAVSNFMEALSQLSPAQLSEVLGTELTSKITANIETKAGVTVDEVSLSPDSSLVVSGGTVELPDMKVVVDELTKNVETNLVPAIEEEGVKKINKNLAKSVLDYEKKRHEELQRDIKRAIIQGFKDLGSVSYDGDISLKINDVELLNALGGDAQAKLKDIVINNTTGGRQIVTTNT